MHVCYETLENLPKHPHNENHSNAPQPERENFCQHLVMFSSRLLKMYLGWAQWLTLVNPAVWECEVGGSLEVKSSRLAW